MNGEKYIPKEAFNRPEEKDKGNAEFLDIGKVSSISKMQELQKKIANSPIGKIAFGASIIAVNILGGKIAQAQAENLASVPVEKQTEIKMMAKINSIVPLVTGEGLLQNVELLDWDVDVETGKIKIDAKIIGDEDTMEESMDSIVSNLEKDNPYLIEAQKNKSKQLANFKSKFPAEGQRNLIIKQTYKALRNELFKKVKVQSKLYYDSLKNPEDKALKDKLFLMELSLDKLITDTLTTRLLTKK